MITEFLSGLVTMAHCSKVLIMYKMSGLCEKFCFGLTGWIFRLNILGADVTSQQLIIFIYLSIE